MKFARYAKGALDIAMLGLLFFLLSYPVTRGLKRHGEFGLILLGLFIAHHLLNLRWYAILPKGRWSARRILVTGMDVALFLAAGAVLTSCLLLAGDVFSFAPFPMVWWARSLHTCSTAWLFIFCCIHAGAHWPRLWTSGRRVFGRFWLPCAMLLLAPGIYCFAESQLWRVLFLLDNARYVQETPEQFLFQYLGMALGLYICAAFLKSRSRP